MDCQEKWSSTLPWFWVSCCLDMSRPTLMTEDLLFSKLPCLLQALEQCEECPSGPGGDLFLPVSRASIRLPPPSTWQLHFLSRNIFKIHHLIKDP